MPSDGLLACKTFWGSGFPTRCLQTLRKPYRSKKASSRYKEPIMAVNGDGAERRLRILCLHGYLQNAEVSV